MQAHKLVEVGYGLNRPECVLAHRSGLIFTSNCAETGGISVISPSGRTSSLFGSGPHMPIKPNGIALEPDGAFLMAHLGNTDGGIYRLAADGSIINVVSHADGHALPPTNFVSLDITGRIWITVSTTRQPRSTDYRANASTGFIAVAEPGQDNARVVADNLGYTNECVIDIDKNVMYVNETFTRRLSRFDLASDGTLTNKKTIAVFPTGTYPDGLTLDDDGNLWVTSIVSNRIIKVTPDGQQTLILEDADSQFVATAELAYQNDSMNSEHLSATGNTLLANTSSLAFGGPDRSMAYLGNLLGHCIHKFQAPVCGQAPVHWDTPLGYLEKFSDC